VSAAPASSARIEADDPAWSCAPPVALVKAHEHGDPRHPTTVRLLHSDDMLAIRYVCEADEIIARMTAYKDKVWTEGAVEAYVRPPGSASLYEIQVSPLGTMRDLRVEEPGTEDQVFDDSWICDGLDAQTWITTDASERPTRWEVLLRLPWRSLAPAPPSAGTATWHVGLFRWEYRPVEFTALTTHGGVDAHDGRFLAELELLPGAGGARRYTEEATVGNRPPRRG
jgi:hypothetical protein